MTDFLCSQRVTATPAFGGLATLGIGFCWIICLLFPYFKFPLVIPYPFQKTFTYASNDGLAVIVGRSEAQSIFRLEFPDQRN